VLRLREDGARLLRQGHRRARLGGGLRTSPKHAGGVSGGLFNTFGNLSSITTPIIIGYILAATGSFNGALVFVGANALVAAIAYLVIVGKIEGGKLKTA
jgi:MFS transporter, ACS family, glucarate transporter